MPLQHTIVATFATLAATACTVAGAASFDCGKARTSSEKLICASPETSALDTQLGAAFKEALARAGEKSVVRQSQRDWLASSGIKDCADARCIDAALAQRISLLDQVAAAGTPEAKWTGQFVRYYKGKVDQDQSSITVLGLKDGRLAIDGSALWLGPNAAQGQVNTGELRGRTAVPTLAGVVRYVDEECHATLRLRADVLEITDEQGCGGMNVTFNGQYKRIK